MPRPTTYTYLQLLLHTFLVATLAYQQDIPQQRPNIFNQQPEKKTQHKILTPPNDPPFPNGPCGGSLITVPPSEFFSENYSLTNIILKPRPIQVWLPPHYSTSANRYPVLYCHDGQNAISDSNSWTGHSFRLTGALTRLYKENAISQIPIVVLLPSSTDDFLPFIVRRRHLEYGDAAGDATNVFSQAHADFVAKQVKPYVDGRFRTVRGAEGSHVMGTSLGGQASLTLLMRHPQSFGGCACLSPCFQPSTIARVVTEGRKLLKGKDLYFDNGGDFEDVKVPWLVWNDHFTEKHWWNPGYFWLDTQLQPGIDAMRWALNMISMDYEYYRVPGGRHNEREWARRIDLPLLKFYGR